jgi:hypothetical protein
MTEVIDYTDPANIETLIQALSDRHGDKRQQTREALVMIGAPAVPVLTKLVTNPNHHVRWETAKALGEINDPSAAPALVAALEDDESDIRWLGAEGLISLGRTGMRPLLEELVVRSDSVQLRDGAHHVIRELVKRGREPNLAPILDALDGPAAEDSVPPAATRALYELDKL